MVNKPSSVASLVAAIGFLFSSFVKLEAVGAFPSFVDRRLMSCCRFAKSRQGNRLLGLVEFQNILSLMTTIFQ